MKALVLTPSTREVSLRELSTPEPGPGEVLIRVHAVALNPVDEFYVANPLAVQDQRVIGTDFAGVVVDVSADLESSSDPRTKIGARVAGFHQGACSVNDRPGAFAEYVTAPYDLLWKVPANLSLEAASTISMCGLTAAQVIFARLGLPSPFAPTSGTLPSQDRDAGESINVLINGASSSVGLYAAQLVHLASQASGRKFRLIGTASRSKHELLRGPPYSYDVLIDYRDRDWPAKVREATGGNGVDYALDCISEGETVHNTHSTLGPEAKFAVIRGTAGGGYDPSKLRVKPIYGAAWEGLGVEIGYNDITIPGNPEARAFTAQFYSFLGSEAAAGKVKLEPNPVRNMPGGLERIVPDGLALLSGFVSKRTEVGRTEQYMRAISAEKLVYTI